MNQPTRQVLFSLLVGCWLVLCASGVPAADADTGLALQIERLNHPLPEARRDAAIAIADYRESGTSAIDPLIRAMDDVNVEVRRAAVVALASVGAQSRSAVLKLVDAMADQDWVVRNQAAEAFETVDGTVAVDALRAQLRADSDVTRLAAAIAVDKLGGTAATTLPELLDMLRATDWKLRGAAARAIGSIGTQAGQAGVDGLATALRDRDWAVAEPVVEALSRIGAPAVPALIDALSDNAVPVRWGAARALGRIGADAHDAVGPLGTALADPVMQVRWASARALLAMGETAAPAADALAGALQDDAWVVRWSAARALGSSASGSSLSQSVDALAAALADRDSRVCEAAAFALETIGPLARAAIPALQQASRHAPDEGDECQVIDAGPAAEQILIDNGWTVRWASVRALGVVGRDDPRIMNTLMLAMQDEVWQVRGVATLALGQFNGRRYPDIVETIGNRTDDESVGVRRAALTALGNAGGSGARDIILAATDDTESAVRDAAIEALKLIDSQGE